MKFKQITIQDSIQLNDGHWRKVEWVVELEDGETPEQKTTEVKDRLVNWFEENKSISNNNQSILTYGIGEIRQPTEKLSPEERTIKAIEQTTTIQQLNGYKLLTNSNAAIKSAYDLQMLKLKQKQ